MKSDYGAAWDQKQQIIIRLYQLSLILVSLLQVTACVRRAPQPLQISSDAEQASSLTSRTPPASSTDQSLAIQTATIPTIKPPEPTVVLPTSSITSIPNVPPEYLLHELPLEGPLSRSDAEISGMEWYQDYLILLPQYPERFGQGEMGSIFALKKTDILVQIDGADSSPLEPQAIPVTMAGIPESIRGYEGFEAIAFAGNRVYLTVEATPGENLGYVVTGEILPDMSLVRLYPSPVVTIPPQSSILNHSEEAIAVFGSRLLTIYELNGLPVNQNPVAHLLTLELNTVDTVAFPSIPYRITDASSVDDYGRFWVINYFYPGDNFLAIDEDELFEQYGVGSTHQQLPQVERLVELQFSEQGIEIAAHPPIQLQLASDGEARNWEALARLDERGFLLATDKFPKTILGYLAISADDTR